MEVDRAQKQPFRFNSERQERIYRRLSLVGPGPAAFFRDACSLMSSSSLAATTHLVAYYLREIESALRGVLSPLTDEIALSKEKALHKGATHRAEVTVILAALEIAPTDPIAQTWLHLASPKNEEGLHRRAHRDSLAPPRVLSAEFRQFWQSMEEVLDLIAAKIETHFLKYLALLDALLTKPTPTQDDLKVLKQHIPNNAVALGYFFDKLENPEWLTPLQGAGFFEAAAEPIRNLDDGTVGYPVWPQSRYLVRMAGVAPEKVRDIIVTVPKTENARVHEDFVEAALKMPPVVAAKMVPIVEPWLDAPVIWRLPDVLGKLVSHLAAGGQVTEALDLGAALLAIVLEPRPGNEAGQYTALASRAEPRGRFDDSRYGRILQEDIPTLVETAGLEGLDMLCRLLADALRASADEGSTTSKEVDDFSYIWREELNDDSDHYHDDVKNRLVTAVCAASVQLLSQGISSDEIITRLEQHPWPIFDRIGLHILTVSAPSPLNLVAARLLDRRRFKSLTVRREYMLLLKSSFSHLTQEQQDTILHWITTRPSWIRPDDPLAQDAEDCWQRDWLSVIADHLSGEWSSHYEQLVAKFGRAQHPESPVHFTSTWVGPTSPIQASDLLAKTVAEIVEYLKEWTAPAQWNAPSAEGLGREIEKAVASDPRRFVDDAGLFRQVAEPTYHNALFRGFRTALKDKKFRWRPVLELAQWAVVQPREVPERDPDSRLERDPDWSWARKSIAALLDDGFFAKHQRIPITLRSRVWRVLEILTDDRDPTPEYEMEFGGSNMDPATMSINTARGEAMHATVTYALWVHDYLKKKPNGEELLARGFDEMPEVRSVLDKHLEPETDPTLTVRSVYGRWFPQLVLLDRAWASANASRIFSDKPNEETLRDAAWETYLAFAQLYSSVYDILGAEYSRAIERIGREGGKRRFMAEPDERLGQHLMILYWWGRIGLDEVGQFFARASAELRGRTLGYVGRSLHSDTQPTSQEEASRVMELWESRILAASSRPKAEAREELRSFGYWFVSERLPKEWALNQLRSVLQIAAWVEPDNEVVKKLAELAPDRPGLAVELVGRMVDGDIQGWGVGYGWNKELSNILQTALDSADESARKSAEDLVNRLGACGFLQFRDLLKPS